MVHHQGRRAVFHRFRGKIVAVEPRAGNAEKQSLLEFLFFPVIHAQGFDFALSPQLRKFFAQRLGQHRQQHVFLTPVHCSGNSKVTFTVEPLGA